MTTQTKAMITLHKNHGMSTARVANIFGMKKNTIIKVLQYHGELNKSMGYDIEQKIYKWLDRQGYEFEVPARRDASHDLMLHGSTIDIKSAHKDENDSYNFQIFHKQSNNRNYDRDFLWLVLLDNKNIPIYELDFKEVKHLKRSLGIPASLNTKYPLKLIGYLGK